MNIIKNIIVDYEQLINTKIQIPLSNGDIIRFTFRPQDLPHLLGLQHLVDDPLLFEYSQKRLSATDLYNRMCDKGKDAIDTNSFEESIYFHELYESRIKYFNSELLLDIIQSKQIIKFDPQNIKNFSTKLDKIEYMFWKRYQKNDNLYGYFGIGFASSSKNTDINYPNTFFFRLDNDYIRNQTRVFPLSFMKKDKNGQTSFEIYWDEVLHGLQKNIHYKKLKKEYFLADGTLDIISAANSSDSEALNHYELLQLDALNAIYLPYFGHAFHWTNNEKRFILSKIQAAHRDLWPHEIKNLLNEYRQKHCNIPPLS